MKNLILIMLMSLPFLMVAQTSTKNKAESIDGERNVYTYIVMEYKSQPISVKSPKKGKEGVRDSETKKTNYVFLTNNERLNTQLTKASTSFADEISALNVLGKMGWELIDVNNGKYYFKSKRRR